MAFVYRLPRVSGLEVDVRGVDGLLMGYVHVTSAIFFLDFMPPPISELSTLARLLFHHLHFPLLCGHHLYLPLKGKYRCAEMYNFCLKQRNISFPMSTVPLP